LSGILDDQAGEVAAAVRRNGMRIKETRQMGDWIAFWVQKPS
jgi:ribosomal protein L11 methylase PrmA